MTSATPASPSIKKLIASTNSPCCRTLRRDVDTALPDGVGSALEMVIDGLTREDVERAMAAGLRAACGPGIVRLTAGNYGGRLGKHLFHPRPLLGGS